MTDDAEREELVLSDGTRFADLIEVERREVSLRVLSDPEIHRLELERIFARAWCVLAHESEIPRPGDFVTRFIGEDEVIVSRDSESGFQVMLNVCAHRGMRVCRTSCGNASQFRCSYHGWVYNDNGAFLGAPVASERMHGDVLEKSALGLRHARVGTYAGMIFATWDDEAPSLDEFLGEIKFYLDLMFSRTDDGLEVLGPPQRYSVGANWKCPSEQHNTDSFHTLSLHRSLVELGFMSEVGDTDNGSMQGMNVSANGHGIRCVDERDQFFLAFKEMDVKNLGALERLRLLPPAGITPEMLPMLERRFSAAQLQVLADFPPSVGGLFPNVGCFSVKQPAEDGISAIICWHAFVPRGPDHFEFFNWYLAERSAPAELKERMSRASNTAFGTGGFVESDDADMWPQMTQSARGVIGRQSTLKYQALGGERRPDNWPGGGHVSHGFAKDDNQWLYWLRYRDFMIGRPW